MSAKRTCNHTAWRPEEDKYILESAHPGKGNKWRRIAERLPKSTDSKARTDDSVRNRYTKLIKSHTLPTESALVEEALDVEILPKDAPGNPGIPGVAVQVSYTAT